MHSTEKQTGDKNNRLEQGCPNSMGPRVTTLFMNQMAGSIYSKSKFLAKSYIMFGKFYYRLHNQLSYDDFFFLSSIKLELILSLDFNINFTKINYIFS